MKKIISIYARLGVGLVFYSIGIVSTVVANLGLAPWDSFHQGLANVFGITFGQASIAVGLLLLLITFLLEEPLGVGTALNVVVIGIFIDIIMKNQLIPYHPSYVYRIGLMFFGMWVISVATWLYIGAGLGAGPRDGLMLTIMRKTKLSVASSRILIEGSVALMGFLLGGGLGLGTVLIFLFMGPILAWWFRVVRFNAQTVEHRTVYFKDLKQKLQRRKV